MTACGPAATAGGQLVIVGHFIRKATGQPDDPSAPVMFTVMRPDLTSTVYTSGTDSEVTNPRVGSYEFSVLTLLSEAGVWTVTLSGGGGAGGSTVETFLVAAA